MDSDRIDLLLELVPQAVMIRFFRRKKTAISSQVDEVFTFLNQLKDNEVISENLYQEVINARDKVRKGKGVYRILTYVEKQGGESIKLFWRCVFESHMLQKYPFLQPLFTSLLKEPVTAHGQLPDAKKLTLSKEKKAERKKHQKNRKKGADETEKEEPNTSSGSRFSLKKTAMPPGFSLPVKKGKKQDIPVLDSYKTQFPVTCGDKEDTLHWDKLVRGPYNKSIGTVKKAKKKKDGIKIKTEKNSDEPKSQNPRPSSESSSSLQKPAMNPTFSLPIKRGRKQDIGALDCYKSQLPVTCGDKKGTLYRNKLVKAERCIRSRGIWYTPVEFERFSGRVKSNHWKTSIRCKGKTLKKLIEEGHLQCPRTYRSYGRKKTFISSGVESSNPRSHSKSIRTEERRFTPEEILKQEKDTLGHGKTPKVKLEHDNGDVCHICNFGGNLVRCDECPRAFHHHCHLPALWEDTTEHKWMCTFCVVKTNHGLWRNVSISDALQRPVTEATMQCEYLLLWLYKEDTKREFINDPTTKVPRYSSVIAKPMWLNRVKTKLQNKEYKTMAQFVSDINLIFDNCKTFNKDNELGQIGARLGNTFFTEFYTIFKIQ